MRSASGLQFRETGGILPSYSDRHQHAHCLNVPCGPKAMKATTWFSMR